MIELIEGNFDNPEVNELLKKHFVELRAASPEKCSCLRYSWIKNFIN